MRLKPVLFIVCAAAALCARAVAAEPPQKPYNNIKTFNRAFAPGEKLTYSISWSNILQAGIAVMEVKNGAVTEHRPTYQLVSHTHSVGIVDMVYPVKDVVESIVDAEEMYSIFFTLKESHGKRKRERMMTFDHENDTVKVVINGATETFSVPERIQDALSSLYYVR